MGKVGLYFIDDQQNVVFFGYFVDVLQLFDWCWVYIVFVLNGFKDYCCWFMDVVFYVVDQVFEVVGQGFYVGFVVDVQWVMIQVWVRYELDFWYYVVNCCFW